jgi:regulatory protein
MKITNLSSQQRDPNRVNVMVDGRYRFSLDILQVTELGVKVGSEYTEAELNELETESQFGKLYARALEYSLMRPHSSREMRDYLYKKTFSKRVRNPKTGEVRDRPGVRKELTERVYDRLVDKGYIDDEKFARFWIENRNLKKGTSSRKLQAELQAKGVDRQIVEKYLTQSERSDEDELQKMIAKKRARYPDEQKFMQYLARQGFSYDDVKAALSSDLPEE